MDPYATISTRRTPQTQQADASQVENNAGGFVFTLDDETRLGRFLTLGSEGSTYYVGAQDLTRDNAAVVMRMAETDHATLVNAIVDVSESGRAPKQNPAIFALAVAASIGSVNEKTEALRVLHRVCRTGTHLFLFARYVEQFRGWGRGLRRAVADWYTSKEADSLAYQVVKYQQREGWSHRDLLRLSHPKALEPGTIATLDWITHNAYGEDTPALIEGFRKVREPGADVAALVREYRSLSWEMLPDESLKDRKVWDALLDNDIPQTALMRQLPRLTNLGIVAPLGGRTAEIGFRLVASERLRQARVHPINMLVAQRTYASGRSARGDGTWAPVRVIVDALDAGFYAAFGAIEPANKRTMLALDVSASMTHPISNMPLSCREASAALSLVTSATEPDTYTVGFTSPTGWATRRETALTALSISPRQRLDDVLRTVSHLPFGGTDCSLPMIHAQENGLEVDTFVVYTDNETWAGRMHPHQALVEYRRASGIDARLIVVGMTATDFSIADPSDPGMLDVAGFDSAVPTLVSDFSRGF